MMSMSCSRVTWALGALVAIVFSVASSAEAQQGGTLIGSVTNAQSGQPLVAVQVFISDLDIGVLTSSSGRYLLLNVPAGTHTVTAERIGHRSETRVVMVTVGGTVEASFSLTEQALRLDEIIVTGTPGGTRRRALGNDVTRLDGAVLAQSIAAPTFEDILSGHSPGVNVQQSTGQVGGGSQIRIRGLGSATLSNIPLLYVDGVRVDNLRGGSDFASRDRRPASRINDFNPEDIESIEIIKGPAAATLYGTEASAGVIQIITKRGAVGAPTFDASVQVGQNYFRDPLGRLNTNYVRDGVNYIGVGTGTGELIPWHVVQNDIDAGFGSPFQNGLIQDYQLSVTGGTDNIRYYVAANYGDEEGYVDYNTQTRWGIRANIDAILSDELEVAISTNLLDSNTRFPGVPAPFGGIPASDAWGHASRTATRGWYTAPIEADRQFENRAIVDRATWSIRLTHNPFEQFQHRLVFGEDVVNEVADVTLEASPLGASDPFLGGLGVGQKDRTVRRSQNISFDYSGTLTLDLSPSLVSVTSAGAQYYKSENEADHLFGRVFPLPGLSSLNAAADVQGGGNFVENASLGIYVQQQFEWNDRIFFTAAVRGDDNSAFGTDFDAAIYPKFSGAWVLSEEEFFDMPVVNSFRLRGAWGQAGRQPDAFAAVSLYTPVTGPNSLPALRPGSIGNADLGPEVGTEIEIGFDAGLFDDRASLTFTFYDQETADALLPVPVSLASGFLGSQTVNIGLITNRGVEVSLDARVVDLDAVAWDVGFNYTYNRNRVEDLGDVPPSSGTARLIQEGFPVGSRWSTDIVSIDWVGDPDPRNGGTAANAMCRQQDDTILPCDGGSARDQRFEGPGEPIWMGAFVNSLMLLGGDLRLSANIEYKGGYIRNSCGMGCGSTVFHTTFATLGDPNNGIHPDPRAWWSEAIATNSSVSGFLTNHDASHVRFRDVSATYTLPNLITNSMGASRATFSVAARNLGFIWRAETEWYGRKIPDPETGEFGRQDVYAGGNIPWWPGSQITATMRVSF